MFLKKYHRDEELREEDSEQLSRAHALVRVHGLFSCAGLFSCMLSRER